MKHTNPQWDGKQFNTITEALTELHAVMAKKKAWRNWPDEFSTAYRFHTTADKLLRTRANADTTKHALWHDAYMSTAMSNTFDALFWIRSFQYIADAFDVPMSWIAALRLTAQPNLVVGDKWGLKPLPHFINSDGYCYDSLWASHLDGVKCGLITNDEFPFERDPESVAISEAALALATTHASNMDMSVDDFLAQVSDDSLDMTLPARGDDE